MPHLPPLKRAGPGFLLRHVAHFVALGFGSGLSPVAPGTAGTLWAWLAFLVIGFVWAPTARNGAPSSPCLPAGLVGQHRHCAHMGVADPGQIVVDEIAAFWLVLWLVMPAGFWGQLAAFVLFRFFDAAKPGPVAWADQPVQGLWLARRPSASCGRPGGRRLHAAGDGTVEVLVNPRVATKL
jgi:phosphatidylglycerophosphatase A